MKKAFACKGIILVIKISSIKKIRHTLISGFNPTSLPSHHRQALHSTVLPVHSVHSAVSPVHSVHSTVVPGHGVHSAVGPVHSVHSTIAPVHNVHTTAGPVHSVHSTLAPVHSVHSTASPTFRGLFEIPAPVSLVNTKNQFSFPVQAVHQLVTSSHAAPPGNSK